MGSSPPGDRRGRGWRWCLGLAMLAVLGLALKPNSPSLELFPEADKVRHVAAFIVLWLIGALARLTPAWALALALLGFGLCIEVLQSFTPTREASLADLAADAVGIAIGWLVSRRDQTALVRLAARQQAAELRPPAT